MSTPPSRDDALEHLLRRRTPAAPAVTPACADAEALAAWSEGGLDAPAMAEIERHLSNCARCQAMLAAIVRSEPDVPAAAPWWSRMHLRWLVPLTAAAAATVLWMIVPPAPQDLPRAVLEATRAGAERSDPADVGVPSSVPSVGATTAESSSRAAAPPPAATPGQPAPARMSDDAREGAPAADQGRTAASNPGLPGTSAENRAREEAPAEHQALAKQRSADIEARSDEREPEPLKDTVAVTGVPPAAESPRTARTAPAAPAAAAPAGTVAGLAESVTRTIPSRDGVARWRLPAPSAADAAARGSLVGVIERSDDGGGTWRQVSTRIPRQFTAGDAPSATICWLVGPDGTVALTSDGRTWRQLPSPAPDADLTSVAATDAQLATVRDTQGRSFRTTDGGASWVRVR